MEQDQCWTMQTKKKFSLEYNNNLIINNNNNNNRSSYDESSWEEQAFAEDAAGALVGGCIWPPRSYSCSFCRREFRSAQALGGHMNVHRRDRARLKQQQPSSPNNKNSINNNDDDEVFQTNPFTSLGSSYDTLLYPSTTSSTTLCGLAFKTNPNSDLVPSASSSSLPSTPSSSKPLLLAPPSLFPPLCNNNNNSSILLHKNSQVYCSQPWSNFGGDNNQRLCSNNKFNPEEADVEKVSQGKGKNEEGEEDDNGDDEDDDDDVGVSLNLVVCRTHHQFEAKEEEHISFKRRKTEASSIPSFLPNSTSSVDRHHNHHHMHHPKMIELNPSSIEELDLELRLGNCSSEV